MALPRALSATEAAQIRRIFALQQAGQIDMAVRATRDLHDDTLLGDILADRYLAAGAKPEPSSLRQWLRRWADLPDAAAIRHRLSDLSRGRTTILSVAEAGRPAAPLSEEGGPVDWPFSRNPLLDRTVQARLAQGEAGARSALRLVTSTRHLDPIYDAMLRAEISRGLFTMGSNSLALRTASAALVQSRGRVGLAGFVAGLVAWRQQQPALAQSYFEQASRGELTSAGTRAGAAFWAARTHRKLHDEAGWRAWMQRAAAAPHTFYGMLALRMLDQTAVPVIRVADNAGSQPGTAVLGEIDVEAVAATAEGRRAFALLQVGQPGRAEAALRQLWPRVEDDAALCRSIALVAREAGMTGLSAQIATVLQRQDGQPPDPGHFPVPRLRPRSGFTVNPALVYALTRLESNFDNRAVSDAGAHGLMQIMPVTANFVLSQGGEPPGHPATSARALHNPALNLEIGQRYLRYLASQDGIHGDLIRLLASYNAGPNAVAQWDQRPATTDPEFDPGFSDGDPLLFIESLPVGETRDFVHRALTYLWIYAARMKLPAPSLDTLSQGEWPNFDDEQKMAAARPEILTETR